MRFIYSRSFAIFAFSLIGVAFLILLQVKGYLDPVKSVFLHSPQPVISLTRSTTLKTKNFFSTIYRLRDIVKQNSSLTAENLELKQKLALFDQYQLENEALRNELGFAKQTKLNLEPCTVLMHNPLGLTDTLVLNCGTEKGVSEGQAVISQGYLVGKIVYAGKGTATALLITNSKFATDAQLSKTGVNAVVHGSFGSGLFLEQVPQNETMEKGWEVVTAGINEQVPKNILIGEVGDILSTPNDLFKKATLLSPVDFKNLEFVFVAK